MVEINGINPYSYLQQEVEQPLGPADLAPALAERDPDKVSQQFSTLFVSLLLKKAFASWDGSTASRTDAADQQPLFAGNKEMYRDIFFKQLVDQLVAEDAFGLKETLEKRIGKVEKTTGQ